MINNLKERLFKGECVFGTWLNLGSHMTAEVISTAGFDWVVIDMEHGAGDYSNLVCQLQALKGSPTVPLVRVSANDPAIIKRTLDIGAQGIIIPLVSSVEEAKMAVRAMKYPPHGVRGVARNTRAAGFGNNFKDYFDSANENILTIVQIETRQAVENVLEIAKVDGIDIIFIGPLDLTTSLGVQSQIDHPRTLESLDKIEKAAWENGKIMGILLGDSEQALKFKSRGYRFIGVSSDMGLLNTAARDLISRLRKEK